MRKCIVSLFSCCALLWTMDARAALTLLTGPPIATHAGNLVVNGSFETGAPSPGFANEYYWVTGTTSTPYVPVPGWTSSGNPGTYALWGSDTTSSPFVISGSDQLPDGNAGLYFGNSTGVTSSVAPNYLPDGRVLFSSAPIFTHKPTFSADAVLSQTVPTHLTPAPSYVLSFWVSGEDSGGGFTPFNGDGIFGLRVTNVLSGDPIQYLAAPSNTTGLGKSIRYEFSFTPLNPLLPVDIEFSNPGHFNFSGFGGSSFTTELVLDDVIVNPLPEPGIMSIAMMAGLLLRRRVRAR